MNRTRAIWIARVAGWSLLSGVLLLVVIGLAGPKPGAPEGERSLGIGPFWLSRIELETPAEGVYSWTTRGNWTNIALLSLASGLLLSLVVGGARSARGGAA